MPNLRVYTRNYVFYQEIEDDNIRRIIDDYQVHYGNYNDVCIINLLETLHSDEKEDDRFAILDFMNDNKLDFEYLIDMSVI